MSNRTNIQFLGSGDAFGSGGRFQTCILLRTPESRFLIDCGASSLIAMKRFGVGLNEVATIFLTHLHADHFGGIPFFLLSSQFVNKRHDELTIAGPPGTSERLSEIMNAMFPGSSGTQWNFPLSVLELDPERSYDFGKVNVTPYIVSHECGSLPFALRIKYGARTLTYTG